MPQIRPKWLKPAFDQRFLEMARQVEELCEVEQLKLRQMELSHSLKEELTDSQYRLVLELQDVLNTRSSIEKEWLFFAGLQDGMQLIREISVRQ